MTQWEFPLDSPPSPNELQSPVTVTANDKGHHSHPLQSKGKVQSDTATETAAVGRTDGMPLGWVAFTDKASGDEYYHHAASGTVLDWIVLCVLYVCMYVRMYVYVCPYMCMSI